jgi:hypothetical protein
VKSAREVAVQFLLTQGKHFCENSYCDCADRLAEVIQWERSVGAAVERDALKQKRLAKRLRRDLARKPDLAKTKPDSVAARALPTPAELSHIDVRRA